MFKYRLLVFLFIFNILLSVQIYAQNDPAFSQFYASGIYLNPAIAGLEHRFAITGIHRSQFKLDQTQNGSAPTTGFLYQTNSLSIIIPSHSKGEDSYHRGGFGINIYQQGSGGVANVLGASLTGAYNIKFSSSIPQNITFGLQAGFVQRSYSTENIRLGSGYDGVGGFNQVTSTDQLIPGSTISKIHPDFTVGLLYYYNAGRNIYAPGISFYLGLVGSHLSRPNASPFLNKTDRVPFIFKLHSGVEIHLARKLNASPNVFWITNGTNNAFTLGASFTYLIPDHDEYFKPTRLVFGYSYRFGDAMIFQIGFGSKYYGVGFSYDLYTSAISQYRKGFLGNAFEVSFKTTLHISKKAKKSSKFHTPLM
ncbi:MAG: type IX secretion system membrane protein PorP/SprF [Bacteroidetes bacterium]|nr:MAG: type IX secretion system membrane protein PorP/SprF [Bacteroidota bacterium]